LVTAVVTKRRATRTSTGPVLFEWDSVTGRGAVTFTYIPGQPASSQTVLTLTGAQTVDFSWRVA
jgi:hypothetical protein